MASQIFFSFLPLSLNWMHVSCNHGQLQTSKYGDSTLFLNVKTYFLGALPASLLALPPGPMMLLSVYGIALNMMKDKWELWKITLYCNMQFTTKINSSYESDSLIWHLKQILTTLELTKITTGNGHKIIRVVQYVLQLVLCSFDLILNFYVCLHFSQLTVGYIETVCVCVNKIC